MYRLVGAPFGAACLGNVGAGSGWTDVALELASPFVREGVPVRGRGLGALFAPAGIAGDYVRQLVTHFQTCGREMECKPQLDRE
jgi:hypothetical protein